MPLVKDFKNLKKVKSLKLLKLKAANTWLQYPKKCLLIN